MGPYVSWNGRERAWNGHIYVVRKGKVQEVLCLAASPSNTEAIEHLIHFLES